MLRHYTVRSRWFFSAVILLVLGCGTANTQVVQGVPQVSDEAGRGSLSWGGVSRSGKDVVWTLIFSPAEGVQAAQLRAEILLPREHWRFRRVRAVEESTLRVSSRTERAAPADARRGEVLVLTVSARSKGDTIPAGPVAQLTFSPRGAEANLLAPPLIRRFTTAVDASAAVPPPAALEPPPGDPPANPAVGCFFFSH